MSRACRLTRARQRNRKLRCGLRRCDDVRCGRRSAGQWCRSVAAGARCEANECKPRENARGAGSQRLIHTSPFVQNEETGKDERFLALLKVLYAVIAITPIVPAAMGLDVVAFVHRSDRSTH